jgi:hypothetical protein
LGTIQTLPPYSSSSGRFHKYHNSLNQAIKSNLAALRYFQGKVLSTLYIDPQAQSTLHCNKSQIAQLCQESLNYYSSSCGHLHILLHRRPCYTSFEAFHCGSPPRREETRATAEFRVLTAQASRQSALTSSQQFSIPITR